VVAFAALGWQSKIHRLANLDEPHHLAAIELHRYPADDVDITLAQRFRGAVPIGGLPCDGGVVSVVPNDEPDDDAVVHVAQCDCATGRSAAQ
jgi:hypothetical protein